MRLYPKKIHNLKELRREKRYLRHAIRQSEDMDFFLKGNRKGTATRQSADEDAGGFDISSLFTGLAGNKGISGLLISAGLPLLLGLIPQKTKKSFLKKFVLEFGTGYLYWKGIQLGFNVLRSILKKKKQTQPEAEACA